MNQNKTTITTKNESN